jgi:hypothetical protein
MSEVEGSDEFGETLHGESFVRVSEWMDQRGAATPLPLPCVITAALWRRLERIPFRILHSTTLEDRLRHLVARARACLEPYDVARACVDRVELTLAFSASLPCRAEDPTRQIVHLRCAAGADAGPSATLTLGLPEDLPLGEREHELARRYRTPISALPPAADAAPSPIHTLRRPRGANPGTSARLPG